MPASSIKRRLVSAAFSGRRGFLLKAAYVPGYVRLVTRESRNARVVDGGVGLRSFVFGEYLDREQLTYLEFGVYKGESIKHIASLNQHVASRFIGFDSFEGLPETWRISRPKGHFSTDGQIPHIEDERVSFIKGWFNRTLPNFVRGFAPAGRLVINIDSDLYSSAIYVLISLDDYISGDAIIMFDEFSDLLNEYRAFADYCVVSGKSMAVIATSPDSMHVAFKLAST